MAHGIMEFDVGMVKGDSTWHKLPQYQCIGDRYVTIGEALEVADYPIEKAQLMRANGSAAKAWEIVRTDHDIPLVDHVGQKFDVTSNKYMLNFISENLLAEFDDLNIESVGTLFNGATFFLNLRVNEFSVKGDKSPTITNLMYANPLGRGSYVACAHNTRIVCNNTEKVAEAEGVSNESLKKFRHTASAAGKINEHLVDMAQLKLALKRHVMVLDHLSCVDADRAMVNAFLDKMFPMPKDEGRGQTIAANNREKMMNIWSGQQRQTLENPTSKYSMYCALTDFIDHQSTSRGSDDAATMFDGIIGTRSDRKQTALEWLVAA